MSGDDTNRRRVFCDWGSGCTGYGFSGDGGWANWVSLNRTEPATYGVVARGLLGLVLLRRRSWGKPSLG
jgi:hypothetical protein